MDQTKVQREAHWQNIYNTKTEQELSWHQDDPVPSLDLVRTYVPRGGRVVDIGGGSSALGGRLASQGFDVAVLDVSDAAIARAKARIGDVAQRIRWLVADVTKTDDLGEFDLWHDRAVFHFLTNTDDRRKYAAQAAHHVRPGGHIVIGTFATSGPEQCSALPVERYDQPKLGAAFGTSFTIIRSFTSVHVTPWGKPQDFFYAVMRKTA